MIQADNIWILWAIILFIAAFSIYLEDKFTWAKKITGAIIAMIIAATLGNLKIIPTESEVYDSIWSYVIPLAIPMLLFQCDIKQIWKESGRMTIIFLISSLGTILGAMLGYILLHNHIPVLNHIAGMMTASYIGGSVNFVAVTTAFNTPSDLVSAVTVSDYLITVIYFFILIAIPSSKFFQKHFKSTYNHQNQNEIKKEEKNLNTSVRDIAFSFASSAVIVALSFTLSEHLVKLGENPIMQFISNKYLILATITVILTSAFPKFFQSIKSSNELGTFLIYIFFVVIGIPASITSILEKSPLIVVFCAIIVLVNMVVTFIGAKIFNFTVEEAIIASNANIGGPTTAVAMAISKSWHKFVAPAMLVGTLGYIIGTYFGLLLGQYLG
ncbi:MULTISPECIES: DUF819 domain-containing protein [unclassified Gemella]|uniref:DUF819 family protein n=1 Tax=unclassified Gemella TaxID=2624949 RepID=UPI001C03D7F6|nr:MULTISPECIES: DUF819 family protein [unclassified Gemella]MBU0278430.1 DUF819 family protein [Gemella sp. zg-1178]QWQ38958.1 DUF819 family protein [Gemella sp. zg-570]